MCLSVFSVCRQKNVWKKSWNVKRNMSWSLSAPPSSRLNPKKVKRKLKLLPSYTSWSFSLLIQGNWLNSILLIFNICHRLYDCIKRTATHIIWNRNYFFFALASIISIESYKYNSRSWRILCHWRNWRI